jgi:hypothetical protein
VDKCQLGKTLTCGKLSLSIQLPKGMKLQIEIDYFEDFLQNVIKSDLLRFGRKGKNRKKFR